jgi:hypothetical protein
MYTLADRVWVFTLKGENVGQEGFYTRIGRGFKHPWGKAKFAYISMAIADDCCKSFFDQ